MPESRSVAPISSATMPRHRHQSAANRMVIVQTNGPHRPSCPRAAIASPTKQIGSGKQHTSKRFEDLLRIDKWSVETCRCLHPAFGKVPAVALNAVPVTKATSQTVPHSYQPSVNHKPRQCSMSSPASNVPLCLFDFGTGDVMSHTADAGYVAVESRFFHRIFWIFATLAGLSLLD